MIVWVVELKGQGLDFNSSSSYAMEFWHFYLESSSEVITIGASMADVLA